MFETIRKLFSRTPQWKPPLILTIEERRRIFGNVLGQIMAEYSRGEHLFDIDFMLESASPGWGAWDYGFNDPYFEDAILVVETFLDQVEHGVDFSVPTKELIPFLDVIVPAFKNGKSFDNAGISDLRKRIRGAA
ncbi:MAG: hypothetical protein ABL962_16530 [Fimbriimonadaceae bacterium]